MLRGMLTEMEFNRSLLPVAATIPCFIALAFWVRKRNPIASDAGQKLMLYGLLWLIIYDSAFVAGYVSWAAAGILLCLLPIAWWSVAAHAVVVESLFAVAAPGVSAGENLKKCKMRSAKVQNGEGRRNRFSSFCTLHFAFCTSFPSLLPSHAVIFSSG